MNKAEWSTVCEAVKLRLLHSKLIDFFPFCTEVLMYQSHNESRSPTQSSVAHLWAWTWPRRFDSRSTRCNAEDKHATWKQTKRDTSHIRCGRVICRTVWHLITAWKNVDPRHGHCWQLAYSIYFWFLFPTLDTQSSRSYSVLDCSLCIKRN